VNRLACTFIVLAVLALAPVATGASASPPSFSRAEARAELGKQFHGQQYAYALHKFNSAPYRTPILAYEYANGATVAHFAGRSRLVHRLSKLSLAGLVKWFIRHDSTGWSAANAKLLGVTLRAIDTADAKGWKSAVVGVRG
jgi:hypothetical protein